MPGLSKQQVQDLIPEIVIADSEPIDDSGWCKFDSVETTEQCVARIKDLLRDFKDFYRENREKVQGKTFVAITHGSFLSTMSCLFTNNIGVADLDFFIPENNSVTIIDFMDVKQEQKEFVDCRLTGFNLKLKGH